MIAGAPGAFGSLVIFNSSCVTGCHSSPAATGRVRCAKAAPHSNAKSKNTRLYFTACLQIEFQENAQLEDSQGDSGCLQCGALTASKDPQAWLCCRPEYCIAPDNTGMSYWCQENWRRKRPKLPPPAGIASSPCPPAA